MHARTHTRTHAHVRLAKDYNNGAVSSIKNVLQSAKMQGLQAHQYSVISTIGASLLTYYRMRSNYSDNDTVSGVN